MGSRAWKGFGKNNDYVIKWKVPIACHSPADDDLPVASQPGRASVFECVRDSRGIFIQYSTAGISTYLGNPTIEITDESIGNGNEVDYA